MARYMYVKEIHPNRPKIFRSRNSVIRLNSLNKYLKIPHIGSRKRKLFQRRKLRFNYGSIFLIVIGGFFVFIAASPLIKYYIDTNLLHKYQTAIVKADPSSSYFSKIINNQTIKNNSNYKGYFYLSIPTINLNNIPVKTNVNGFNTQAYEHVLVNSLAQMKGTALPGETGNVYVYGHSAPQWFTDLYPSSFLGIFTNILKLSNGNLIYLKFQGKTYTYKVFTVRVVQPTDFSVLAASPNKKYLTLMTCIPPGIGTQRYIVKAMLVK